MKTVIILFIFILVGLCLFAMRIESEIFSPALNIKSTVAVVNGEYLDVDFSGEALNILIPETREVLKKAVADAIIAKGIQKPLVSNVILYASDIKNAIILPGQLDCDANKLRECLFCCLSE